MKLFQLLLFFVSIDLIVSQCEDVSDVKFLLIRGKEISKLYPKAISWRKIGSLLNSKYFDKNKRTVVYAHGFTESIETISTQTVISAYLKRKSEYNILIIDWTKHNDGNYILRGIPNALKVSCIKKFFRLDLFFITHQVGAHIGRKLLKMSEIGFDLHKFEIVGHSLGTHVVGAIGRTTKLAENGFQLKRITGLDPAGPTFFPLNPFITPLNAFDAAFVDIIHTDAGMFGANVGTGHADFWPNGGKDQPGCPPYDSSNMLKIESKFKKLLKNFFQILILFKISAITSAHGNISLSPF